MKSWWMAVLLFCAGQVVAMENKVIYGYVEKVILSQHQLSLSAKLDTGAKSASLYAVDIESFEVKDVPYLRFRVPLKNGSSQVFEAEYIGKVKIKARVGEFKALNKEVMKRPVVLLRMQLGDKVRFIEVNLANRQRFNYPLLLGRDAINEFDGLIDPSSAFLIKTVVKAPEPQHAP